MKLTPILKLLPWAVINSLTIGFLWSHLPPNGRVAYLVFSAWWIAANVTDEICKAIQRSKQ